ncbi:hypothetical protein LQZ24_02455 [Fructobacillus sp. M1-13]|uniref:Uncharacterized protein n=1 Tax=Fructobacillus papyriferae TaxID=2713171 RepID=A0ABS5QQH5_9LACO|nr:hypothetical protein [Fructobacillus papyriferae]MBS9335438.1 hypothetical protein [Fructobacillus papyriferae]MCD2158891.1 hypothetical protein [Fructobacillus papyriferae]
MTMVAATVIAYRDDLPYFLVEEKDGKDQFLAVKVHQHHEETSLGMILKSFAKLGVTDFDSWRLGELQTIKLPEEGHAPLYSFHVTDFDKVIQDMPKGLVFKSGDEIQRLLMTVQPTTFTAFDE